MSIDRADRIVAQLGELTREDYGALPPAERRRLITALEEAHRLAKVEDTVAAAKDATAPDSGVLIDLKDGRGRQ